MKNLKQKDEVSSLEVKQVADSVTSHNALIVADAVSRGMFEHVLVLYQNSSIVSRAPG